jgi:hypothetical protein
MAKRSRDNNEQDDSNKKTALGRRSPNQTVSFSQPQETTKPPETAAGSTAARAHEAHPNKGIDELTHHLSKLNLGNDNQSPDTTKHSRRKY